MTSKKKPTSRILKEVHETARDLQTAGFVSKGRMKEYDALCLLSVPETHLLDRKGLEGLI
jgi:putative transcriptional regulator